MRSAKNRREIAECLVNIDQIFSRVDRINALYESHYLPMERLGEKKAALGEELIRLNGLIDFENSDWDWRADYTSECCRLSPEYASVKKQYEELGREIKRLSVENLAETAKIEAEAAAHRSR